MGKEKSRAKSKPDSNPAKRGAQGPRQATSNPTNTRRTLSVSGDTGRRGATDAQGRPRNPPPTQKYKPRVSNVVEQTNQARRVAKANPGRAARAARRPNVPARAAAVAGGLYTAGQILRSSGKPGAAKMSRLGIGGNAPVSTPKPKPTPKKPLPVSKKPIQAPPKKGSTVLAKKNGKEGVLRNGVFYATGFSPAQRNRYEI